LEEEGKKKENERRKKMRNTRRKCEIEKEEKEEK
jgi:hypothetical protein